MTRDARVSSFVLLGVAVVIAVESYRLGLGTLQFPQAGFFPFVASVVLGVLALVSLRPERLTWWKPVNAEAAMVFDRQTLVRVACVAVALVFYAVMLNRLGFVLVSMLFIAFMLRLVAQQRWPVVFIGTVAIPIAAYLIFAVGLHVQLPEGLVEALWTR